MKVTNILFRCFMTGMIGALLFAIVDGAFGDFAIDWIALTFITCMNISLSFALFDWVVKKKAGRLKNG